MKKINPDFLRGTFSNLHITNKKSNIASIVEEMDKEEMHSIKLITSSPRDEYLRMKQMRRKLKNIGNAIILTNNLLPQKKSFPLIKNKNKSKKNIKNLLLNNSGENKKHKKKELPHYLLGKGNFKIRKFLTVNKEKKDIIKNDDEEKKLSLINEYNNNKKTFYNTLNKNSKNSNLFSLKKNNQLKTIDVNILNNKQANRNNFIIESFNNENKEKYYKTSNNFSEKKLFSHRKMTNKKKSFLSKTNSEQFVKSIPRLKISEAHLSDIENKLNTVYESNKNELIETDKEIQEFKRKYNSLFDKNEQLFSYDIARITKEINAQLLSLKFKDFYSYLLTILKNYDKHIVDWKFNIDKDKNECPSELRLKNVKIKHKNFMKKLNKQYDWGLKVNKFMDDLLLNTKKNDMLNNDKNNNNDTHYNYNNFINKKNNPDDFVDKIFEKNELYQNNQNNLNINNENS